MTLFDLLVVFLAGMQLVELYHHGSLFGAEGMLPIRNWAEWRTDSSNRWVRYVATLLVCPFCEAPWACTIAALGWCWGCPLSRIIVFALAASRLANIVNDMTHSRSRSPRSDSHSNEELEVSESVN